MATLAERLGYSAGARVLILGCDDLGFCHAANVGVYEALRQGVGTTAGLMVPCPWARAASAAYRGEDVGVKLTVNAEFDLYRWAPLTQAPSLLDGDGGFPRTITDVWDHADLSELRRECRAQIERAILWGFDISHLDAHLGAVQIRSEFFDVYLELALEFRLPLRLSAPGTEANIGFPFRSLAEDEGAVFPDDVLTVPVGAGPTWLHHAVADLRPGITEVTLRPAVDSPELRAIAPDWKERVADHHAIVGSDALREALDAAGVHRIGYRPLRDLMRGAHIA